MYHIKSMKRKLVVIGVISVAVVIVGLLVKNTSKSNQATDNSTSQTNATQEMTNTESAIPMLSQNSLAEAATLLNYTPKVPSVKIGNESLSEIRVGVKNPSSPIDESDALYLTYAEDNNVLFKTYQSSKNMTFPPDAEKVTINGNSGIYYLIPGDEGDNANAVNSTNASVPRSYIEWQENTIFYEISEFGRLSKNQLIQLAESLTEYD